MRGVPAPDVRDAIRHWTTATRLRGSTIDRVIASSRPASVGDMSSASDAADVDVLLLHGRVIVRAHGAEVVYTAKQWAKAPLVAALAMSAPDGLTRRELEYEENFAAEVAVWKLVERVNKDVHAKTGIEELITRRAGPAGGYRLRVEPERVDAVRFLRAADADPISFTEASAALTMWSEGPMSFREGWMTVAVTRLTFAHARLAAASAAPQRVLIVDDQIAHTLAELLQGESVRCTPARSVEEFRQYLPVLDDFALLLLDINLTPDGDYADQLGLRIADEVVSAGSRVPMLGMTYRLSPSADDLLTHVEAMIDRGLVGVSMKGSDDPTQPDAHVRVVNRVHEMLAADPPGASSIKAIAGRLDAWEERAREIQRMRSNPGDAVALVNAMKGLRAMSVSPTTDLGALRVAVRDFRRFFLREAR